ncbi:MAG: ribbon-helix-helix protein, CopG family [Acidiferrobacterales bacterium]
MPLVTLRIDDRLARLLDRFSNETGQAKSELIRIALQRQFALMRFEGLRRRTAPFAEIKGWLTDEDVFREGS